MEPARDPARQPGRGRVEAEPRAAGGRGTCVRRAIVIASAEASTAPQRVRVLEPELEWLDVRQSVDARRELTVTRTSPARRSRAASRAAWSVRSGVARLPPSLERVVARCVVDVDGA